MQLFPALTIADINDVKQSIKDFPQLGIALNQRGWDGYNAEVKKVLAEQAVAPENPTIVTIETANGEVTMTEEQWNAMPDTGRLALTLGREPTLSEYISYKLIKLYDKPETEELENIPIWARIPVVGKGAINTVYGLFPETQAGQIYPTEQQAIKEWVEAYSPEGTKITSKAVKASAITEAEELGIAAAKALYPQIIVSEVTADEWISTGVSRCSPGSLFVRGWYPYVYTVRAWYWGHGLPYG